MKWKFVNFISWNFSKIEHSPSSFSVNCGMANSCWEEVRKTFPETIFLGNTEMLQWQVCSGWSQGWVVALVCSYWCPGKGRRRKEREGEGKEEEMQLECRLQEREWKQIGREFREIWAKIWKKWYQKVPEDHTEMGDLSWMEIEIETNCV